MKENSKAINIQDLPEAKSRVEEFLDFLCGRATVLADLPKPKSRVEEFLEYLCYRGGIGGGGGQAPTNAFVDARLDDDVLVLVRPDGTTKEVPLDVFVKEWKDLEYVEEYPFTNLVDFAKRVEGVQFDSTGQNIIQQNGRGLVDFEVVGGAEYTLIRQRANHGRICFYGADGVRISFLDETMRIIKKWNRLKFQAPQGSVIATLELKTDQDNEKEVMIFEGDQTNLDIDPAKPIPYADGQLIQVGSEISLKFDNSNSTFKSTTVNSVIKEIDTKIVSIENGMVTSVNGQGPDVYGNVQIEIDNIANLQSTLDGKVANTDLTVTSQPDKVLQLDNTGKIDVSVLPNISINRVHSVNTKDDAMNLINTGVANIGDVFIVADNDNRVYMYTNENESTFDAACVELTMGDGTVLKVNGLAADGTGNVTIRANNITLADGTSSVEAELNKRLKTINNQPGNNGNINLSINVGNDGVDLQVEGASFGKLTYINDTQVNEIISLFV